MAKHPWSYAPEFRHEIVEPIRSGSRPSRCFSGVQARPSEHVQPSQAR